MIPYRDDNPTRRFPVITVALIVINVVVWVLFRLSGDMAYQAAVFEFGMIPYEIFHHVNLPFRDFAANSLHYYGRLPAYPHSIPPYLSLLTSMFMHGGLMHLAGNMLYLWIFGNNVEDYLGRVRFGIFYLLCGAAAAGAHLIFNPGSRIPTVGASGAISGVLAAYLLLYPRARVHVLIPVFYFLTTARIPAWFMIVLWFAFQLLALPASAAGKGGVAYWAHVGGFVFGFVWILFRRMRHPPGRVAFRARS